MPAGPPTEALLFTGIRGSGGYSAAVWVPLDSHYPVWVVAPWSPFEPSPRGAADRKKEGTRSWPQGTFSMEGHCGVAVPLISGGRNSGEAERAWGRAALSRPVCPPFFPPAGGPTFLLSIHPSFPHPSVHSSPSFHVSGDPLTEPQGTYSPLPSIFPPLSLPTQSQLRSSGLACGGHTVRLLWSRVLQSGGDTGEDPSASWGPGGGLPGRAVVPWAECGGRQSQALWNVRSPQG